METEPYFARERKVKKKRKKQQKQDKNWISQKTIYYRTISMNCMKEKEVENENSQKKNKTKEQMEEVKKEILEKVGLEVQEFLKEWLPDRKEEGDKKTGGGYKTRKENRRWRRRRRTTRVGEVERTKQVQFIGGGGWKQEIKSSKEEGLEYWTGFEWMTGLEMSTFIKNKIRPRKEVPITGITEDGNPVILIEDLEEIRKRKNRNTQVENIAVICTGSHWVLAKIKYDSKEIQIVDPYPWHKELKSTKEMKEYLVQAGWEVWSMPMGKQKTEDNNTCGAHVLVWIEMFLQEEGEMNWLPGDYNIERAVEYLKEWRKERDREESKGKEEEATVKEKKGGTKKKERKRKVEKEEILGIAMKEEIVIMENPKVIGSKAWERYEMYKEAKTLEEAIDKGGRKADMVNDIEKGYIVSKEEEERPRKTRRKEEEVQEEMQEDKEQENKKETVKEGEVRKREVDKEETEERKKKSK